MARAGADLKAKRIVLDGFRAGSRLATGVVVAAVLAHAWAGFTVSRLGHELTLAHDLTQRLDRELNELLLETAGLVKPDALAREAQMRLGLERPTVEQVVELPVVRMPGGATSRDR